MYSSKIHRLCSVNGSKYENTTVLTADSIFFSKKHQQTSEVFLFVFECKAQFSRTSAFFDRLSSLDPSSGNMRSNQ